ncbi:MAG: VTT domain-containing protein [Planctomycetota bacterium]
MSEDVSTSTGPDEVRFRDFGRAGPLAITAAVLPALGGFALLGFMPQVSGFLNDLGRWGFVLYVAAFALTSGFAILPTYAQAALGGYAFGLVGGIPGAMLGFVGGSIIGYAVARLTAGDDANKAINDHPKWRAVRDAFVARTEDPEKASFWRTLGIVTLIRFPPNSPFALTNLLMASVRVPKLIFLIGTAVGMLPRTALVVFIGHQVAQTIGAEELTSDVLKEARPGWLLPVGIGLSVVVLVTLAVLGDKAIKKAVAAGEISEGSSDAPSGDPSGEGGSARDR